MHYSMDRILWSLDVALKLSFVVGPTETNLRAPCSGSDADISTAPAKGPAALFNPEAQSLK